MAESTEITFGYLRRFREEHVGPLLSDLRGQRSEMEAFIDVEGSSANSIRVGNPLLFPAAGKLAKTINGSVVDLRDQLTFLINQFEGLWDRLEEAEFRFADAEDDSVITSRQLAELIDPASAGAVGPGTAK